MSDDQQAWFDCLPSDGQTAIVEMQAENARLRERVAALADTADDLVSHPTPVAEDGRCWFCGSGLGSGPTGHKHACAWRRMKAALAQADDGVRA